MGIRLFGPTVYSRRAGRYDEDGEIADEHIFCSRCLASDSTDDNDIVLCDGPVSAGLPGHWGCRAAEGPPLQPTRSRDPIPT